jgi:hypothetical protein
MCEPEPEPEARVARRQSDCTEGSQPMQFSMVTDIYFCLNAISGMTLTPVTTSEFVIDDLHSHSREK